MEAIGGGLGRSLVCGKESRPTASWMATVPRCCVSRLSHLGDGTRRAECSTRENFRQVLDKEDPRIYPAVIMVNTISASRVGAMEGVDPRMSPLALYHELRGELPPRPDDEAMMEGRFFEDAVARIFASKYNVEVDLDIPQKMEHGVLSGHADRFWRDGDKMGVLEVKNTMFGGADGDWGDPGSDKVPLHYWFQAQVYGHLFRVANLHSEECVPADSVFLAARLSGGVRKFEIKVDEEVVRKVGDDAHAFLARVREGNPPDPRDEADMRMRWLVKEDLVATGGMEQLQWAAKLKELSDARKEIEKQESDIKTLLLGFAKDASKIVVPHPETGVPLTICTLGADRSFDAAAFQAAHPDVAARYMRLDATKLGKEQRTLYERFMRKPADVMEQKRVIRLKEVKL